MRSPIVSSTSHSEGIRVGTCGFCTRQQELFDTFDATEIQQTFYWPPQRKTVERWRSQAPEPFEFTLKAFQAVTHPGTSPTYRRAKLTAAERAEAGFFRDTDVVRRAWETTRELAIALRAAYVVFQCPTSFTPTDEHTANLRRFFGEIERSGLRLGWEPRGKDWTTERVATLCRELDLIHIVDPFQDVPAYGAPLYFRLHGRIAEGYRYTYDYRYSDDELRQVLAMCAGQGAFVMFNNIPMCDDARRFAAIAAGNDARKENSP